ncbi:response regulator transcription factor [Oxalobacter vibrioformis]|uniref:Response regulator transcription factor n=1 Tax=Oxalobacter vibrioformis TaxID=933080 RepID=A0A9E9P3I8_9BURK|nr:response regulator transcription factor [Oxalobacter vibrioformis]WAW10063.1 response regulator transcription factor [Oxalobacter vibrioformis]
MTKILLIDDDVELTDMLADYLKQENFTPTIAHDGEEGVDEALSDAYSMVILDVMMPKMGGTEVLKRVRQKSTVPVLMLTAKGDDTDRILGLELGADDYVPKPCTPRELTARIRAILRRVSPALPDSPEVIHVGLLEIYPENRHVTWDGTPVVLTSTEFNLLKVLARHAGQPVSKNDLSLMVLDRPMARFDRNIDVHMSSLRQKLPLLPGERSCIQTVYKHGYQLIRE